MAEVQDLELDEDMEFQEREWRVERFGWFGLLLVVVLAMLGLFGNGPISWTSASTDDGSLEVSFERFGRRGGSQDLGVTVDATAAEGSTWEIELSQGFVDSMRIDSIIPEPDSVEAVPGGVRYTFAQADPTAELEARFSVTPRQLWGQGGEIGLTGGEPVTISYFLFP